jgi:hypothetical protein
MLVAQDVVAPRLGLVGVLVAGVVLLVGVFGSSTPTADDAEMDDLPAVELTQ